MLLFPFGVRKPFEYVMMVVVAVRHTSVLVDIPPFSLFPTGRAMVVAQWITHAGRDSNPSMYPGLFQMHSN